MTDLQTSPFSPWPHRVARVLVCATFPLIWVGGLVTTYDAGMAVPDWPATYGHNLFLYPWQTWIAGPWDLFIEHGHRLLGALVGLLSMALLVVAIKLDHRGWLIAFAVAALVLVIVQGVLGGQRVLRDDRRIAQIHGCVGPVFFTLTVALAAFTSRWWRSVAEVANTDAKSTKWSSLLAVSLVTMVMSLLQLLLGSQLRHGIEYASPQVFRTAVTFHVVLACLLVFQTMWTTIKLWRAPAAVGLRGPVIGLLLLVGCQFLLGVGTWAMKFGWPAIFQDILPAPAFTVQAESMGQSLTVTAHVAIGSLILATSGLLVARTSRLLHVWTHCRGRSHGFGLLGNVTV